MKLLSYVSMILLSLWILKFIRGILKSMKLLKILHVIMGIHFELSCIENKNNLYHKGFMSNVEAKIRRWKTAESRVWRIRTMSDIMTALGHSS